MIDRLTLNGAFSRAPELTRTINGTSSCRLQPAVSDLVEDRHTGVWGRRSHCFDIDVCGATGERCYHHLNPGGEVTISGRLRWQTGPTNDNEQGAANVLIAQQVKCSPVRKYGAPQTLFPAPVETPVASLAEFVTTISA